MGIQAKAQRMSDMMRLIEEHEPMLPEDRPTDVGSAVSLVRWLVEREKLAPRVVVAAANPDSGLSFADVTTVITSADDLSTTTRKARIYTKDGAERRSRLALCLTAMERSRGLVPFESVTELVSLVHSAHLTRIHESMRAVADVADRYLASLARREDDAEDLLMELADAVTRFAVARTGAPPSWVNVLDVEEVEH